MLRLRFTDGDLPIELPVDFYYTHDEADNPQDTICKLYSASEPDKVLAVGIAALHHKDHFNKVTGRKLAFSRALKQLDLPKEWRTQLWNAYKQTVRYR